MNAVIYFSCSGQSKAVAEDLAKRLGWELLITDGAADKRFESAVIVFPVHCQSFPTNLKSFFKTLNAGQVSLIATYGRAHHGNALYEANKLLNCNIIAAAYLPAKHTYCGAGETTFIPEQIAEKIRISCRKEVTSVKIPKLRKTPFAGLLPAFRSKAIVKIRKNENCTGCNACAKSCPVSAIEYGKPSRKCTRCLKCVFECPHGALYIKKSGILRKYLKIPRCEKVIIYI